MQSFVTVVTYAVEVTGVAVNKSVEDSAWEISGELVGRWGVDASEMSVIRFNSEDWLGFGGVFIEVLSYALYAILIGLVSIGNVRGRRSGVVILVGFLSCGALLFKAR